MKVLNVVSVYFSLPFFFGDQIRFFSNKGYEMHIVCSPSSHLKEYANEQKAKYSEIEISRSISPLKDIIAIIKISQYIRRNKIDIVVGHTPKGALVSMIAATIMGVKKRIYFRHGLVYTTKKGILRTLLKMVERFVAFCSTEIVSVSRSLSSLSVSDNLNSDRKQKLIGQGTCGGIDAIHKFNPDRISLSTITDLRKSLNIDDNEIVIGYCGRLVRDKGIIELVRGFQLFNDEKKNVTLLLVGDYEIRDTLPQDIKNVIDNHNKIIRTGFIPNKGIESYYALMNVFILPSYREGFGMCVLEASAMKLPVLTTKSCGCIDSIVESVTGKYIEITPESICSGIKELLKNPELCNQYGVNGRNRVLADYDHTILWPEIEKLYN